MNIDRQIIIEMQENLKIVYRHYPQFSMRRGLVFIVDHDYHGFFCVVSPYHQTFIDELKRRVPYTNRIWNSEFKAWIFTAQYFNIIEDLCKTYFDPNKINYFTSGNYKDMAPEPQVSLNTKIVMALNEVMEKKQNHNTIEDVIRMTIEDWQGGNLLSEEALGRISCLLDASN